jgi:alpha-tubulin suppressor-like RCC1 family protein
VIKFSKNNRILVSSISIIVIIAVSIFLYHYVAYMKYSRSTIIGTASSWYANREKHTLIEITTDGRQYEHNFKDKANAIKTDTKITFICEDNTGNSEGTYLIIHNNGNIYTRKQMESEAMQIGLIKDAICGAINQDNIAIITADERLYFKGKLGNSRYDDFSLISGIPNVKQVICGKTYTFVITVDGEVYGIGLNPKEQNEAFIHYKIAYPVKELCGTNETIVALDQKGNVYELGNASFKQFARKTYSEFHRLKKYKNIVSIATGYNHGMLLDKRGRVHYWGNECIGKAAGVYVTGTIKGIFSADDIYCSDCDLYIIQNNKVFYVELHP